MSAPKCPNCGHAIAPALISQWHGEATGKLRATHAGWPKGVPRGAMRPEQSRCACGAMTAKRALARGHKCDAEKS